MVINVDFSQSKWIWAEGNETLCDRAVFRRTFSLEKTPKTARVCICARDRVSLYVNGRPVALGVQGCAAYDVAKYLCKGDNVLGFDCLYYGRVANGYVPPATSGLIVASDDLQIYSDKSFSAFRPYAEPSDTPTGRYFGFDSYVDGGRGELGEVFETSFGSTLFVPATEYGRGGEQEEGAPVNGTYDGTLKVKKMTKTVEGVTCTYVYDIGTETAFYPVLELAAMGTEKVELKSDRYRTPDRAGSNEIVTGVRATYVCRNGTQSYFCPVPLYGSALVITAPATVNIRTADLRVVRYPMSRVLRVEHSDGVQTLLDKCDNTMRACTDGGIFDNSDRDRGTDLFALSVYARAAVYTYGDELMPLLGYEIRRAAESLCNYAGTPWAEERPIASLLFCSRLGAVAAYYNRTGDTELLTAVYERMCAYVLAWEADDRLLLRTPAGQAADAGFNIDPELIETCLYYSAADFLANAAEEAQCFTYAGELKRRAAALRDTFDTRYYRGGYYSSGTVCDERAVALAVLTGLAAAHEDGLRDALCACHNASPAYEGFVVEALGKLGKPTDAEARLLRRFAGAIQSESPVLREYFFRDGSACSSLAVGAAPAFISGVAGISYTGKQKLRVRLCASSPDCRTEIPAGSGTLKVSVKRGEAVVENGTGLPVSVVTDTQTDEIGKGKSKFSL